MRRFLAFSVAAAFSMIVVAGVLAQSSAPPAGGGASTPPAGAAPSGEYDLPLDRPSKAEPAPDRTAEEPKFYGEEVKGDKIVFVMDQSGSMDWDVKAFTGPNGKPQRGTRMVRAKTELSRAVSALTENFEFNIVAYDCDIRYCWSSGLQKATPDNKGHALGWIHGVEPLGGTGTGPATAAGLRLSNKTNIVVLLTDGAPNCGANGTSGHRQMIKRANSINAKIDVFGIGVDDQEFRQFLIGVANDNNGKYVEVP